MTKKIRNIIETRKGQKCDCRLTAFSLNELVEGTGGEPLEKYESIDSQTFRCSWLYKTFVESA